MFINIDKNINTEMSEEYLEKVNLLIKELSEYAKSIGFKTGLDFSNGLFIKYRHSYPHYTTTHNDYSRLCIVKSKIHLVTCTMNGKVYEHCIDESNEVLNLGIDHLKRLLISGSITTCTIVNFNDCKKDLR